MTRPASGVQCFPTCMITTQIFFFAAWIPELRPRARHLPNTAAGVKNIICPHEEDTCLWIVNIQKPKSHQRSTWTFNTGKECEPAPCPTPRYAMEGMIWIHLHVSDPGSGPARTSLAGARLLCPLELFCWRRRGVENEGAASSFVPRFLKARSQTCSTLFNFSSQWDHRQHKHHLVWPLLVFVCVVSAIHLLNADSIFNELTILSDVAMTWNISTIRLWG